MPHVWKSVQNKRDERRLLGHTALQNLHGTEEQKMRLTQEQRQQKTSELRAKLHDEMKDGWYLQGQADNTFGCAKTYYEQEHKKSLAKQLKYRAEIERLRGLQ